MEEKDSVYLSEWNGRIKQVSSWNEEKGKKSYMTIWHRSQKKIEKSEVATTDMFQVTWRKSQIFESISPSCGFSWRKIMRNGK